MRGLAGHTASIHTWPFIHQGNEPTTLTVSIAHDSSVDIPASAYCHLSVPWGSPHCLLAAHQLHLYSTSNSCWDPSTVDNAQTVHFRAMSTLDPTAQDHVICMWCCCLIWGKYFGDRWYKLTHPQGEKELAISWSKTLSTGSEGRGTEKQSHTGELQG